MQKPALNVKVKQIEQGNGYVKVWSISKNMSLGFSCENKASGIRTCGFM